MNRNEFKTKIFSLFIEFLVAENRPSRKKYRRPKQKSKKSAKPTISYEVKMELMVGFADFLLFCFGLLYFFRLGLFSATRNSINSEKIFVLNSFRFMPAQLTRFGIDRNSAILSIAWRVILLSNFFLQQEKFFFLRDCFAWW